MARWSSHHREEAVLRGQEKCHCLILFLRRGLGEERTQLHHARRVDFS